MALNNQNTVRKFRNGERSEVINRRNFETTGDNASKETVKNIPNVAVSTFRPPYKRRTFTTSTTTKSTPTATVKVDTNNRFKKIPTRRPITQRTTSENTLTTLIVPTNSSLVKKTPLKRGNYRPKPGNGEKKEGKRAGDDEDENYPEHFKQLLKNKEVNTQENDKGVLKKPVKSFRPSPTTGKTNIASSTVGKGNAGKVLFPTRSRFLSKPTTSTTEPSTSSTAQTATVTPKRPLRNRSRPTATERTKVNVGSTLQEPPTAKSTVFTTKAPPRQSDSALNTQTDETKQIDPPIREYFPRTKVRF